MDGAGVLVFQQMIEIHLLAKQSFARERGELVCSQHARVSAARAEPGCSDQRSGSQAATLALGMEHMGLLVGSRILIDMDQFIDSHCAQTENVEEFAHAHLSKGGK